MIPHDDFDALFQALTGNPPFPWQRALYEQFVSVRSDNIPALCNLPTGLGKTSVVAIWLIALAKHPEKMPRRLVYVVNRRTVVDQTTYEVEKYREQLKRPELGELGTALSDLCSLELKPGDSPLALSTLRGQFADNREWSADPARPAVICGTVDMIGSRLLFSGYGVGFKTKPLHAGFLGQDVLMVHDEAHLEPAFQKLMEKIVCEQVGGSLDENGKCEPDDLRPRDHRPLRIMELTATTRSGKEQTSDSLFSLGSEDRRHPIAKRRIEARKQLTLTQVEDDRLTAGQIAKIAAGYADENAAVLVFTRTLDGVATIAKELDKTKRKVVLLTGTVRGTERDEMVNTTDFKRFLKDAVQAETVYLVCTSAGEVGVNISADHMVCDLSTFESMAQRLGRVNRYGDRTDTRIDVVFPSKFDEKDKLRPAREATLELLRKLNGDASPLNLGTLGAEERQAAFAPTPDILLATDILFDAWSLTTIKGKLPGRPPVEPYLHGISDYDPPQTTVAWRKEVELLSDEILQLARLTIEDVLEMFPLKPHETLSMPTEGKNKTLEQLEKIAARGTKNENRLSAWVVEPDGTATSFLLQDLVQERPVISLHGCTVILPPQAGGLTPGGLLQGDAPFVQGILYDVSEEWFVDKERTIPRRIRIQRNEAKLEPQEKMRLLFTFDLKPNVDDEVQDSDDKVIDEDQLANRGRYWHWFVRPKSAEDDGSKTSQYPVTWQCHTDDVECRAKAIGDALLREQPLLHQAIILAARFHDLGKKRTIWQRSIGNPNPDECYAKSGKDPTTNRMWRPLELSDYRHEFGSLVDLHHENSAFAALPEYQNEEIRDLVLHLIAVHHGFGRPHFPHKQAIDPDPKGVDINLVAAEVPRRFAKLQRKYGRWGLAYLESLLRAADYAASANPTVEGDSQEKQS